MRAKILDACGFNMKDPLVAKTVMMKYQEMPISIRNRVDSFINDELRRMSQFPPKVQINPKQVSAK